ncbi:hypothetical protein B0H13DRAFT_2563384 [Mycena leptocephala]|nr:hypothetical protein B0H13DRAFT_2563384 [Mycena leptocephala]
MGKKTRCTSGGGYWGNSLSSHCNSTETRSTRRNWKPQTALHNPRRSTTYPTGAGTAGLLARLHKHAALHIILHHASYIAGTLRRTEHTVAGHHAPTPLDSTPLTHTRRNHWQSSASCRSYTALPTVLVIASAPKFPAPLDSTPDWCGYSSSAGDPSSHPLASPSDPIASDTPASTLASGSAGMRRPYCVSNFHPPPHHFDLTRCTKAVYHRRARAAAASILRMTSRTFLRISSLSIHPSSSRPMAESSDSTHHQRGAHVIIPVPRRVAIAQPAPLASRTHIREEQDIHGARTARGRARSRSGGVFRLRVKESVSKNAEYSEKGAAEGCDIHLNVSSPNDEEERRRNGRGGRGNRRTWDELVALDTVDQTLDKSIAHVEGRIEHKTSAGCRGEGSRNTDGGALSALGVNEQDMDERADGDRVRATDWRFRRRIETKVPTNGKLAVGEEYADVDCNRA